MKIKNQRAVSLVQVLIAGAALITISLGVTTVIQQMLKSNVSSLVTSNSLEIRRELVNNLQNDLAWQKTKEDPSNTSLACLNTNSCSSFTGTAIRILNAKGALIYDGISATSGFTIGGAQCNSFDAVNGDNNCPIRVNLTWEAVCPVAGVPCSNPQEKIHGVFVYKPKINSKEKNVPYNVEKYNFSVTRGEAANTLQASCTQIGGTFDQATNECDLSSSIQILTLVCTEFGGTFNSLTKKCSLAPVFAAIGLCPDGEYLAGFDATGVKVCNALPAGGGGASGPFPDTLFGGKTSASCIADGGLPSLAEADTWTCKFNAGSCSGVWSPHLNWSSTATNSCTGTSSGSCTGTSCITGQHVWSNSISETCTFTNGNFDSGTAMCETGLPQNCFASRIAIACI